MTSVSAAVAEAEDEAECRAECHCVETAQTEDRAAQLFTATWSVHTQKLC